MRICFTKSFFMLVLALVLISGFAAVDTLAVQADVQNQNSQSAGQSASEQNKSTKSVPQNIAVRLNKKKVIVKKDRSQKLRAIKKNAASRKIIWSSSNRNVAKVNKYGLVTGKKGGNAIVTARVSGTDARAVCKVVVQNYRLMRMRTTGYCNCRRCAGRWAGGPTAIGRMPKAKHTIAVDRRLIKLGTKVQIGNIVYTAEDTGGAIRGNRIDVYYSSHRQASRHGVKYALVKVFY